MEYVSDRGAYADVPREEMLQAFERLYPNYKTWMQNTGSADFERDVRPDGVRMTVVRGLVRIEAA